MREHKPRIETLLAKAGRNPGECVATVDRAALCFLPHGCQVGQNVRVVLEMTDRRDRNGRPVYRGHPAPKIEGARWRDNGDGILLRLGLLTDWLGAVEQLGVVETRPPIRRDGNPVKHLAVFSVVWGADRASSYVENRPFQVVPLEEEAVENELIVWRQIGEKTEALAAERFDIVGFDSPQSEMLSADRLAVVRNPEARVMVHALFHPWNDQWVTTCKMQTTWAEMPLWWRDEQDAHYPVCSCGKMRRHVAASLCQRCVGEP